MKTVLHTRFGPPEELRIADIAKPVPRGNEVLIKVHATSVTTSDCNVRNLTFAPKWVRPVMRLLVFGVFRPRKHTLGIELAGEIEAVGPDSARYGPGAAVFGTPGDALGAYAEYAVMPDDAVLTAKPPSMSWEQAATISLAGNTALYFIRNLGNVKQGRHVLIHGASGAIGTFAVQLAKHFGAHVTGVCSTANTALVSSLGADAVIDYTREDFTRSGATYDVIFDVVGKTSFARCKHLLTPHGVYLTTLPTLATVGHMLLQSITGKARIKTGDAAARVENLIFLKELFEAGRLTPVIDRRYPLTRIAEAFRYVEQGHKKGSVVVTVDGGERAEQKMSGAEDSAVR